MSNKLPIWPTGKSMASNHCWTIVAIKTAEENYIKEVKLIWDILYILSAVYGNEYEYTASCTCCVSQFMPWIGVYHGEMDVIQWTQKGLGDAWVSFHPTGPDSRNDQITVKKWSDHWFLFSSRFLDPIGFHERSCFDRIMILSYPARYVDRCWIRNFITTIGHFISNITIVTIQKLQGKIYWKMISLVSTVCIFSMMLITYTYLSNMACPNRVVSWANTVYVHWTGHDALISALINDVATPPIVTSWINIISLTVFIQSRPRNFNSQIPSEWFMSWFNWQ